MDKSFVEFLENIKQKLASEEFFSTSNIVCHVVLGNQACDLDSAVCSLCLSRHLHNTSATPSSTTHVPILNIKRHEYHLKTEVIYMLEKAGITQEKLIFLDDVDLHALRCQERLRITLVDMNVMPDIHLDSCVINVIDHHAYRRNDQVDSIVETVGSCATLVGETIMKNGGGQLVKEETFMTLLYAAILIDTSCLLNPSKTTQKDTDMVQTIEVLFPSLQRQALFEALTEAKNDVSSFSVMEVVMKDLKTLHVPTHAQQVAISSVNMHPGDFFTKDKPQKVLEALTDFTKVNKLLILMFISTCHNPPIQRHLALFSRHPDLLQKTTSVLFDHREPNLELQHYSDDSDEEKGEKKKVYKKSEEEDNFCELLKSPHIVLFKQNNLEASRKIILPLLQDKLDLIFESQL